MANLRLTRVLIFLLRYPRAPGRATCTASVSAFAKIIYFNSVTVFYVRPLFNNRSLASSLLLHSPPGSSRHFVPPRPPKTLNLQVNYILRCNRMRLIAAGPCESPNTTLLGPRPTVCRRMGRTFQGRARINTTNHLSERASCSTGLLASTTTITALCLHWHHGSRAPVPFHQFGSAEPRYAVPAVSDRSASSRLIVGPNVGPRSSRPRSPIDASDHTTAPRLRL